ncbi:hypothetical protein CK510_06005 [Brunnivagina elsteri CCALA 953]|uniref:DUF1822 domain-containing protein n=2 Tax=Brunnivagina TaxID=3344733 RepID=A0A2A2TMH1_9CYAN|nr:hypothetical protein CK510_06005 [Calothrix elsteri CCALA 953]
MDANQLAFTIPIDGKMFQTAERFSQQEKNKQKSRVAYLNTLAILAIDFYCQCIGIKTEPSKSHGLDNIASSLMNTASLFIKDKGLIECRPVLPKEKFCEIPSEVLSERIGYMVVEIDEGNRQAKILGFVESVENEILPLNKLNSLRSFLLYLHQLQSVSVVKVSTNKVDIVDASVNQISEGIVKLSKWFEGLLDGGWEAELAVAKDLAISPVDETEKRESGAAKFIHLQHPSEPVLLILRQTQVNQDEVEIVLRLYPASESIFLLDGIKMTLLDEEDKPIPQLEKQSKANNWLQLRFKGNVGDEFSLKISLGEDSILEKFII